MHRADATYRRIRQESTSTYPRPPSRSGRGSTPTGESAERRLARPAARCPQEPTGRRRARRSGRRPRSDATRRRSCRSVCRAKPLERRSMARSGLRAPGDSPCGEATHTELRGQRCARSLKRAASDSSSHKTGERSSWDVSASLSRHHHKRGVWQPRGTCALVSCTSVLIAVVVPNACIVSESFSVAG